MALTLTVKDLTFAQLQAKIKWLENNIPEVLFDGWQITWTRIREVVASSSGYRTIHPEHLEGRMEDPVDPAKWVGDFEFYFIGDRDAARFILADYGNIAIAPLFEDIIEAVEEKPAK
jgi:hypothetical protein